MKTNMPYGKEIRDKRLHYVNNRETARISALSLNKMDKNEYLAGSFSTI